MMELGEVENKIQKLKDALADGKAALELETGLKIAKNIIEFILQILDEEGAAFKKIYSVDKSRITKLLQNYKQYAAQKDEETLMKILEMDDVAFDKETGTRNILLETLEDVGSEAVIPRLIRYSRKIRNKPYHRNDEAGRVREVINVIMARALE